MEIKQMKKGKSIRIFLIAIVALAIVAVTAICVFGTDGTVTRGDMNGDGRVDSDDAVYLLRHTFLPSRYPVGQSADVNGDGKVNSDDAVYLLRYTFLPERYPLACDHKEVTDAAKPATCTETGLTEGKHCSVCGKVLVEQKVIPITHDCDEQKFSIVIKNDGSSAVKRMPCQKCSAYSEVPYCGYYVSGTSAYKFGKDGRRENLTNVFIEFKGDTYYVVNNVIVKNYYIIDGKVYNFGDDGKKRDAVINNVYVTIGGDTYYVVNNVIVKNYYIIDGKVYNFGNDGKKRDTVINNVYVTIEGDTYYVVNNVIVKNYYIIDGKVYNFGDDGKKRDTVINNVYVTIEGDTYYVVNNVIVKNYYIIDGKVYNFGDDGKKRDTVINNVIISIEGNKYYVVNNVVVINSYVFDDGHIYRFGSGGVMLIGTEFGGYVFGNDGRLTSNDKTIYIEIDGVLYEVFENTAKKHAHNYSEKIIPATCTSKGYTEHICSCGSTYKDNEKPMTEHNYVDDVCTGCGKQNRTSEGLIFSLNSDRKSYTLFGIGTCKDTEIVIPSEYDGFPVIAIGDYAFYGCFKLTSITIPDGVTSIGNYAFSGCEGLTSIVIPDSVTSIGGWAFECCSGLTSVTIGNSVTSIGGSAFSGCEALTSIVIPDSVTSIGKDAFTGCVALESIAVSEGNTVYHSNGNCLIETASRTLIAGCKNSVIPADGSVTSIGGAAFSKCTSLTSIAIPDSVTVIYGGQSVSLFLCGAFEGCTSLTSVTFGENSKLESIGDMTFLGCTALTNISIPSSVTSIGDSSFFAEGRAFSGCTSLVSVTFGENSKLESICNMAFEDCKSLASITIPNSVTSIGYGAFENCLKVSIYMHNNEYAKKYCETNNLKYQILSSILHEDETGSLKWVLYENGLFEISGNGEMPDYKDYSPWYKYRGSITSVMIGDGVTSIGNSAFSGCEGLTSITIPDSVTSIGNSAFSGCKDLTSITIPNSVTYIGNGAFSDCSALGSITVSKGNTVYHSKDNCLIETASRTLIAGCKNSVIPTDGSVTRIGGDAFNGCTGLTSITIPGGVTSIGDYAFYNCPNVVIYFCNNEYAKKYCETNNLKYQILPSILHEGESGDLKWVLYENGLLEITGSGKMSWSYSYDSSPWYAYRDSITSVTIGDGVTSIGDYAFYECTGLTLINIPDGVMSIGNMAFYKCTGLASITIPDGVTSIGGGAFYDCSALESITVSEGNTVYHSNGNCLIGTASKTLIAGCKNSVIPADGSVTSIGEYAFYGCEGLTSITIPDSVTSIGAKVFYGCVALESITVSEGNTIYHSNGDCLIETASKTLIAGCRNSVIPADGSVTSIGEYAFYGCEGLTSVIIPDSVTSIGGWAFYYCTGLTSVTIPESITYIDNRAFGCNDSLYVIYNNSNIALTIGENIAKCAKVIVSKDGIVTYQNDGIILTDDKFLFDNGKLIAYVGNLKNVTLPTDINGDPYTIHEMRGIKNIIIPNGIKSIDRLAFSGCKSLTSITIPDSVTSIGDYAFYYCTGLTSVTIGNGTTSIGYRAFSDCPNVVIYLRYNVCAKNYCESNNLKYQLLSAVLHEGKIEYLTERLMWALYENGLLEISGNGEMSNCHSTSDSPWYKYRGSITSVMIGDGVKSIGDRAFYGCEGLTSIVIPDSVTIIGMEAFSGCKGLTSITIPNGVTSIGDSAFRECNGLTSIVIPDSVTSIGNGAFSGCSGLTSIVIPDSVTSIGDNAFYGCSNLQYSDYNGGIYLGNDKNPYMALIKGTATSGIHPDTKIIADSAFSWCEGLTSVTIGNSVTSIGDSAFSWCEGLTSVTIGNSVTSIGDWAFSGCKGLTSVTIGNSVTSIGDHAFSGCKGLTSVTIGNSVTSIGNNAFYGCSKLTSVIIPNSVTSIGYSAFYGCSKLETIIFKGTEEQWNAIAKRTSWNGNTGNYTMVFEK